MVEEFEEFQAEPEELADNTAPMRMEHDHEVVRVMASSYHGRAFMWMLLVESGCEVSPFAGEAPLTLSYNAGRGSMGFMIKDLLFTVASEIYSMMRNEATAREQEYARRAGSTEE